MTGQMASLQYRQAATQQASVVGLVIALHDTLLGNLRRAAQAIEMNDIPTRCNELIHGFKVLQQLDAMLDMENGGATAVSVRRFYGYTREQMLRSQFKLSASILRDQIKSVLEVRQAWHQLDSVPLEMQPRRSPLPMPHHNIVDRQEPFEARVPFNCAG